MHHSKHRPFIQETSEEGKNQIQDHVKKRKECVIAKSGFTSRAKNATMTEYQGGVHLVNRLQRKFNYFKPSDTKKVNM